jgi:hypothetical protein
VATPLESLPHAHARTARVVDRDRSIELELGAEPPSLPVKVAPPPVASFVISGSDMRVKYWSPGMASAAPMLSPPVGQPVWDLPFVTVRDGTRFVELVHKIFQTPAQHNDAAPLMLHLRTSGAPVRRGSRWERAR